LIDFLSVIISWLERKNLFQTFDELDEVEIEQEIKEIRLLLDDDSIENNV